VVSAEDGDILFYLHALQGNSHTDR